MRIFLLILLLPVFAFSQPPKNANTITITGLSYKETADKLLDAGYFIDKSDPELGTLITFPVGLKDLNAYTTLRCRIKDNVLTLTGTVSNPMLEMSGNTPASPISNIGAKGSPARESWNMMYNFAVSLKKPAAYSVK